MNEPTDTVVVGDTAVGARATTPGVPDERDRWRCDGCGKLTWFDVVREAKTREFWHLDLSGAADVADTEVVTERHLLVSCRWCGCDDAIEVISRPGADAGGR